MEITKTHRYARLAYGVVALLFLGLVYGWSIMKAPLSAEFSWSATDLSLTFTITMISFCIFGLIGSFISRKCGVGISFLISAIMCLAGFILTTFASVNSVLLVHFSYGLLIGGGIGISYNALLGTTIPWFSDRVGLASGLLFFGFGLGSFILGSVAAMMFDSIGWRPTYIVLGIATAVILLLAIPIIRLPKEGELPQISVKKSQKELSKEESFTPTGMLKTAAFYLYFIANIMATSVCLTAINSAKQICEGLGAAVAIAVFAAGFISICNGVGRILFGLVVDKIGFKKSYTACAVLLILAPATMVLALITNSIPVFFVAAALSGLAYGGCPTCGSVFANSYYGAKYYATNVAIINLTLIPASFLGPLVSGALFDAYGTYLWSFVIMIGTGIITLVCTLFIKRPRKR